MFCPHCGKEKDENANFCENCGASVSEIKPSASSQQPLTFEEYIKKNAVANPCTDRGDQLGNSHRAGSSSTFQTIRKRKSNERFSQIKKKEKKDEVVKIKIGIIELDGKRLKIRRSSLLPVDVRKSDTLVPVKNAGVQKQLAHNRHLRDYNETEWLLLYPDMDIVGNIPGSSEKFSVEKYKNELGRPYSRVNLYICKMLDFEVANDLTEDLKETVVPDTADVFEDNSVQENSSQIICELGNSQQVNATPDNFVEVNHAHTNAVPASLAKASLVEASHVQTNPVPSNVVNVDNSCVEAVSFQVDSFSVEQIIMEPGEMPAQIFQDADVTESLLDIIEPEPNLVQPAQVNLPEEQLHVLDLLIHRTTLLKDMITEFYNPNVLKSTIFFKVVDARGMFEEGEGRGVARDLLTEFWHLFYQSLSIGASTKVPAIRHDYQKLEWEAVARIMLYGYCKEGVFPITLCSAFVACTLHGEDSVSCEVLLNSFMEYMAEDEREVVDNLMKNRSQICKNEDLLEVLGSYKCYLNPTEENIEDILCQLAHQELIQRPRYVSNCWATILQSLKSHPAFQDVASILCFYQERKPTSKKVLKILDASPENEAQRNAFDHLVRYIKSLGGNVTAFLQFTTGSDIILEGQKLKVSFTELNGLQRRPVAHTCGPLLEIPSTYQFYNELVEEFSSILREKSAWSFDIV